jgi:hypothetical protein
VTGAERALAATLLWMTVGAAAAVPALVVPQPDDPLVTVTIHLVLLVLFAVALTFHLARHGDDPWFSGLDMGDRGRRALTWVAIVVMVTGATGLVTLATSAALRYDPSLQFLQMLSALDIAWAAAALTLGARRRFGGGSAVVAAAVLGIVCVWAIWRYLDTVGFDPDGGWLLRASELNRLVLPYDMAAAVVAVIVFSAGVRRDA